MAVYVSPAGEFPQHIGDIERENDGWTSGDALPDGWHEVTGIASPTPIQETVDEAGKRYLTHLTQHVCSAELVDGEWTQVWVEGERLEVGAWDDETGEWVVERKLIADEAG
jgi:hypothetical protein